MFGKALVKPATIVPTEGDELSDFFEALRCKKRYESYGLSFECGLLTEISSLAASCIAALNS